MARGPSGVTYLTGESLPEDLRDQFLLANYRGPSSNCTGLIIKVEPNGAGYHAVSEEILFKGVGVSDVELGYDGNIYICDFGGGWSVNENGAIQVLSPKSDEQKAAGARVAKLFKEGFNDREIEELTGLLSDADRRVRQAAQFALVKKGDAGIAALTEVAKSDSALYPRLHAIWGLGQAARQGSDVTGDLISLLSDQEPEVRANAARVLGDSNVTEARDALIKTLTSDESGRVRSLATIALSRVCDSGDEEVVKLLFEAAVANGAETTDIVLRHAQLTALSRLATEDQVVAHAGSDSDEARLLALLTLRRAESPKVAAFLQDKNPLIVREAARALYDTDAVDTDSGEVLASLTDNIAELPETIQRRIVAANFRRGGDANAGNLLALAANTGLHDSVRAAALHALKGWGTQIETDPVHGDYRPIVLNTDRSLDSLTGVIGEDLREFLAQPHDPTLITLALELSTSIGVPLAEDTLIAQATNEDLPSNLRVAVLASLSQSGSDQLKPVVVKLLDDKDPAVKASAVEQAFALDIEGFQERAHSMIKKGNPLVARAALKGIPAEEVAELWSKRDAELRPEIQLDAYLLLAAAGHADAAAYAAEKLENVFLLTTLGGDPVKGEVVFRNQGACLQCHKIGKDGGVQGPDLTAVGKRLTSDKILESIYNPGAEISKGYGMTTVLLNNGESVVGRLSKETDTHVEVIGLDNSVVSVQRSEIQSVAPPVSAMPPMAAALPPTDLRDLVAYLAARQGGKSGNDASHGDEKIAK
ncbi:MAG: HEAT repeat domain-containing protein [Verrucomicrobiales bacterium]|nr:HEAT repeat domain-containing protein [Verrucomicrobiales bacterium]